MILNLKDIDMNNYISWVYSDILNRIKDTGWVTLELEGDVRIFTAGYNIQVRRIGNTVYFRGRITNVTANDTLIAVLPVVFRPNDNYTFRFMCPSNGNTFAKIAITPASGQVLLEFNSDGEYPAERWISLNNIVYATD